MTQIYLLQGQLFTTSNNTVFCNCQYNNKTLCIHIQHHQNTFNTGDIVTILLNPVNQWILQNRESLMNKSSEEIKHYFNPQCFRYVENNCSIVDSTLELIELINNRIQCKNMIMPTANVYQIIQRNQNSKLNENESYQQEIISENISKMKNQIQSKLELAKPVNHSELHSQLIQKIQDYEMMHYHLELLMKNMLKLEFIVEIT